MRFLIAMPIALAAAAAAVPAQAANVVPNIDQIAQVMRTGGYTVELKGDPTDRYIRASHGKEAYSFLVLLYGCDEKSMNNCKSAQFYAGFNDKTPPSHQAMNDYARDNRWGRIYLDKKGDPVIEMDVDLEKGGMSEVLFLDNLEYFETVMNRFAEFVFKE